MKFISSQIKGKGRGRVLGYPTINMIIPQDFDLPDGIYAVWVTIAEKTYKGALHFGPIPTFQEEEKSLEVFLLDVSDGGLGGNDFSQIIIETRARLRDIIAFDTPEALRMRIEQDVAEVSNILT